MFREKHGRRQRSRIYERRASGVAVRLRSGKARSLQWRDGNRYRFLRFFHANFTVQSGELIGRILIMRYLHRRNITITGIVCLLIGLFLSSCNASIEKIAGKPVKIDQKYQASIHYPLATVVDFESLGKLNVKNVDYSNYHYDLIKQHTLKTMQSNLDTTMYSGSGNKGYNGYVKCSLVSQKSKMSYWEIIPALLTADLYMLCGGPIAHCTLEREYRFDIYDALGNNVKSYTYKGKGKNNMSLMSIGRWEGTELKAFRSALKKFDEAAAGDADYINIRLAESAKEYEARINRPFGERDLVLSDWLNSGEMPSEQELNDAVIQAPSDYVGWGLRAIYNSGRGAYNAALNDIEEYCKLNPTCDILQPYIMKGMLLYKLGRKSEAYEAFYVADKLYPGNEYIKVMIGSLLCEDGAYNVALQAFQDASKLNPDNTQTLQTVAELRGICERLSKERQNAEIDESMRLAMATQVVSNAVANATTSIAALATSTSGAAPAYSTSNSGFVSDRSSTSGSSGRNKPKTKECSMCHGKGWIAGTGTASFDSSSSYYCDECHRDVPSSHSHDLCPSCRGNKEVTTLF